MTELIRWNPWERRSLINEVDRLFDDMLTRMERPFDGARAWGLAVDVAEQDEGFIVKASIPGVAPEDVEITLSDNVLTIKGEVKEESQIDQEHYHLRERRYGQFMRAITLPAQVDADKIEATSENGVLTLNLPKAEAIKPKRIAVKTAANVIEGQTK